MFYRVLKPLALHARRFSTILNTSRSILSHIKTRREGGECFMRDQTQLTSVLNGFKNVSVRSPHWRSSKSAASELRNSKLKFMQIKTLIKNVSLLNFLHELLMSF